MVTVDDTTKSKLSGLLDSDGKITITEDMPEDLKECIKYLNDNNIGLFSESDSSAYIDDSEADPFAPGYVDTVSDNDFEDVETIGDETDTEELLDDNDIDDSQAEDLNDLF